MSHADKARDALRDVLSKTFAPARDAGSAYAAAHRVAINTDDLEDTMRNVVSVILAADRLAELAAEAAKMLRDALCEQMLETGGTKFRTEYQTVYIKRKPAWVSVNQSDMVPPEYMTNPKPEPDKKAIKKAIKAKTLVAGCTLISPNSFSLVIEGKS